MEISTLYSDYLTSSLTSSKASTLSSKISSTDYSSATDDELMEVCKEFESYFIEQIFDTMLESTKVFSDDDEDSYASRMVDYFKDTAVQTIASQVTEQGTFGLAQIMYEQMKHQYNSVSVTQLESKTAEADDETTETTVEGVSGL